MLLVVDVPAAAVPGDKGVATLRGMPTVGAIVGVPPMTTLASVALTDVTVPLPAPGADPPPLMITPGMVTPAS